MTRNVHEPHGYAGYNRIIPYANRVRDRVGHEANKSQPSKPLATRLTGEREPIGCCIASRSAGGNTLICLGVSGTARTGQEGPDHDSKVVAVRVA